MKGSHWGLISRRVTGSDLCLGISFFKTFTFNLRISSVYCLHVCLLNLFSFKAQFRYSMNISLFLFPQSSNSSLLPWVFFLNFNRNMFSLFPFYTINIYFIYSQAKHSLSGCVKLCLILHLSVKRETTCFITGPLESWVVTLLILVFRTFKIVCLYDVVIIGIILLVLFISFS